MSQNSQLIKRNMIRLLIFLFSYLISLSSPQHLKALVFQEQIQPFLTKYCIQCHSATVSMAGIRLDEFNPNNPVVERQNTWQTVLHEITVGRMPPQTESQPTPAEIKKILNWITSQLSLHPVSTPLNPGRVTARRLNRAEYKNTIRDLLGIEFELADEFPVDDSGYGFDNIGDVLSLSPLLMEKYMTASELIASQAVVVRTEVKPTLTRYLASRSNEEDTNSKSDHTLPFSPEGTLKTKTAFSHQGEYDLRIRVADRRMPPPAGEGDFVGPDLPSANLAILMDGEYLQIFRVEPDKYDRGTFDVRIRPKPGVHLIEVIPSLQTEQAIRTLGRMSVGTSFNTPVFESEQPQVDPVHDRLVFVDSLEIQGPFLTDSPSLTPSHRRVFICGHAPKKHLSDCPKKILNHLVSRAYRRPATASEIKQLNALVQLAMGEGAPLERGIQLALQTVLVSPYFLFRLELDSQEKETRLTRPIGPYELASRLSYFLWSSLPDEELFRLASESRLNEPVVLRKQIERMLKDPKSIALVENFAGQWLQLRNLESVSPDPDQFPAFDNDLRKSMRQETEAFFTTIMRENRNILEFLESSYSFLNERLARHYGITNIKGNHLRRVPLLGNQRGGLITQASILTVSSYPTRTSPVLRGKWLLENILGSPPPPPPSVETLDENGSKTFKTLRERLENHRNQGTCATCHQKMDALGFGLENFDAIGAWRTQDGESPIDSSGELPGGRFFQGPQQLKSILLKTERNAFVRCLTEKMLTFALGRGLEIYDKPVINQICKKLEEENYKFSELVLAIVKSLPFQRRAIPGEKS